MNNKTKGFSFRLNKENPFEIHFFILSKFLFKFSVKSKVQQNFAISLGKIKFDLIVAFYDF